MSKIGIVIHREYMTRVRKKSFIILTFLMPVLFVGLIAGTLLLSMVNDSESRVVVVADQTGEYFPILKSTDQYQFVKAEGGFEELRKNSDKEVYATLIITGDLLQDPSALTLYSHKQVVVSLEETIKSQLNEYLSDKKLASYDIPNIKTLIKESQVKVKMQSIKWDEEGNETESSAMVASIVGMIFTFLIYMFIFAYGGMVMQGVLEEKTNRIVEVMVSSVKPFDLMMGKLIGIGLVGLTQFGLWAALLIGVNLVSVPFMAGSESMAKIASLVGTVNFIELSVFFVIYFLGGFLIYASLFAAIGAMVNNQEDTQQYMMPITILILFAFYAGFYSAQNPDGPLAFWTSIFPLTSPIVMMTRVPYGVPWWELALSLVLLLATVILIIKLAAKIYRVGILMYGKKPDFKELVKWLKY